MEPHKAGTPRGFGLGRRWRAGPTGVLRIGVLLPPLAMLTLAVALGATGGPGPERADDGLAAALRDYRAALARAVIIEGRREHLEYRLFLHPDAWVAEVLERLEQGLEQGRSPAEVRAALRALPTKLRRQLEGRASFRLELYHPRLEEEFDPEDPQPVQFLSAETASAVRLTVDDRPVQWKLIKLENLTRLRTLRVARHYTVKNRARVPFMSPVKPKHPRLVFWGKKAALVGVINRQLLERQGRLTCRLQYEDFLGQYDDRHIIDLNEPSNVWKQGATASASGPLPVPLPPLPAVLEAFIAAIDAPETPTTPGKGEPDGEGDDDGQADGAGDESSSAESAQR